VRLSGWSGAVPVELSGDRRFAGRVRRLAAVSALFLGLIWWAAANERGAPGWAILLLAAGWATMPTLLVASLWHPLLRVLLVIPSTLVTFGLAGAIALGENGGMSATAGWLMLLAGILMGDVLGLWFWLRLAPAPVGMDDPFATMRWAAICVHIALILLGLVLVFAG
jgi:hypothetical protein